MSTSTVLTATTLRHLAATSLTLFLPTVAAAQPVSQQWPPTTYTGSGLAYAYGVAVHNGAVYVAGYTRPLAGQSNMFFLKYNLEGNQLFARTWGGSLSDGGGKIASHENHLYVAGMTTSYADDRAGDLEGDAITVKWSEDGVCDTTNSADCWWTRFSGDANYWGGDSAFNVAVDASGNLYVVGRSERGWGNLWAFVQQYDSAGVAQWHQHYGTSGAYHYSSYGGLVLSGGNVFTAGHIDDGSGDNQLLVHKYTTAGASEWAYTWGNATTHEGASGIVVSGTDIYVAGSLGAAADPNGTDLLLVKLHDDGASASFVASTTLTTTGNDTGTELKLVGGTLYVVGSIDVGGNTDSLLAAYDTDLNLLWDYSWDNGGNDVAFDLAVHAGVIYIAGMANGYTTAYVSAFIRTDCNNNGIPDDEDISIGTSVDCNANGVPDECEIADCAGDPACGDCQPNGVPDSCDLADCPPGVPSCADCNGNGIPDACDIADCPGTPDCDDCNLNGVPDGCDDPVDNLPDECVESTGATVNWSDGLNWPLGGDFPDNDPANPDGVPDLSVTLDAAVDLLVDVDIVVDTLRLLDGAVLRVTQGGAARVTQVGTPGDFAIAMPGGIQSAGTIFVDNDRTVDAAAGAFSLSGAGKYVADPDGTGTLSASLTAGSVTLLHSPIPRSEQLTLIDGMHVTSLGSFVMDGTGSCDCPFTAPECPAGAAQRGGPTPPIARVKDVAMFVAGVENGPSIRVEADFVIECVAELCIGCEDALDSPIATVELLGSFVNRSVIPSTFRWLDGRLLLSGLSARTFEAGGIDFGRSLEGFDTEVDTLHDTLRHTNFAMGTVELAAGASVEFVNRELNTVGSGACQEALYIDELILGDDSTVTATGTRVYYANITRGTNTTITPPTDCGGVCTVFLEAPQPDGVAKNRFLSILGSNPGRQTAIQITLLDLPPPYDLWNGRTLWVGPTSQVSESAANVVPTEGIPNFTAATLQCAQFFADWTQEGTVHVFHEAILPGATYEIREIEDQCADPTDARNFSSATPITTSIWGDTLLDLSETPPLPPDGAVNIADALGVIGRFSNVPGAIIKARADLEPACLDLTINVTDVLACLAGFVGLDYPFTQTASDPCDSTCPGVLP